jgi:hypothetical protein
MPFAEQTMRHAAHNRFDYRILRHDRQMTTLTKRAKGRPSKGARHTFTVKPDIERAKKLQDALDLLGTDGVTLLTPVVDAFIDTLDLDALRNQEALPIAKAG